MLELEKYFGPTPINMISLPTLSTLCGIPNAVGIINNIPVAEYVIP